MVSPTEGRGQLTEEVGSDAELAACSILAEANERAALSASPIVRDAPVLLTLQPTLGNESWSQHWAFSHPLSVCLCFILFPFIGCFYTEEEKHLSYGWK